MFPFKEEVINENLVIREFVKTNITDEQMWHRDAENRTVVVLESGGWSFQRDNDLPIQLTENQEIFIPKETWHRVIQGKGVLRVKVILGTKIEENKNSNHHPDYKAPEGSERDKKLDQTKKDLKRAKQLRKDGKSKEAKELEQRAYNRRDRMEKKEREKNESIKITEVALRKVIRNFLVEKLSAQTKKTLRKKAKERGFTPSSVEAEFKKGLAAYASSGSRKGMTAHQWAYARVNSATPSKPWAVVKKSKSKKKK